MQHLELPKEYTVRKYYCGSNLSNTQTISFILVNADHSYKQLDDQLDSKRTQRNHKYAICGDKNKELDLGLI